MISSHRLWRKQSVASNREDVPRRSWSERGLEFRVTGMLLLDCVAARLDLTGFVPCLPIEMTLRVLTPFGHPARGD